MLHKFTFIYADFAIWGVTASEVVQEGRQHVAHFEQAVCVGWLKLAIREVEEALYHLKAIHGHGALEVGSCNGRLIGPEISQPGLPHMACEEMQTQEALHLHHGHILPDMDPGSFADLLHIELDR